MLRMARRVMRMRQASALSAWGKNIFLIIRLGIATIRISERASVSSLIFNFPSEFWFDSDSAILIWCAAALREINYMIIVSISFFLYIIIFYWVLGNKIKPFFPYKMFSLKYIKIVCTLIGIKHRLSLLQSYAKGFTTICIYMIQYQIWCVWGNENKRHMSIASLSHL